MKRTKATLKTNINNDLADNASQQISPRDVRQNLIDIVDSVGNIMINEEIVASNFSTPGTRTTIAGEDALSKIAQESYVSVDNVAVGYAALKNNFQGERNTAIGSYALSCNVFGTDNVAVGFAALDGNSTGVGNVGVGEYTLYYNKTGNMNVAIGHGAGYYADQGVSNKLFIGVHPVTEQYVCDNSEGVGLTPLVYGDFNLAQLGVNVNDLHPYGSLQVSGAISPSEHNQFSLGHENYYFSKTYTKSIELYEDRNIVFDGDIDAVVVSGVTSHAGDVDPHSHRIYALGSPDREWHNIHTFNLNVAGTATINELNTITSCLYECKTLYMATSGVCEGEIDPCGYLAEENLLNAGMIIPASGTDDQIRNYQWVFIPSGAAGGNNPVMGVTPATIEAQSCWSSNMNVRVEPQNHLITERVASSGSLVAGSWVYPSGGKVTGMFVSQEAPSGTKPRVTFTTDGVNANSEGSRVYGTNLLSQFNFIVESGVNSADDEYGLLIGSVGKTYDPKITLTSDVVSNGQKRGFDFINRASGLVHGLFINAYPDAHVEHNTVTILNDGGTTGGVLGVHNFAGEGFDRYPETILNARSDSDAALRVTAENAGDVSASLELCGEENCLSNAAEFVYNKTSGVADIATYLDSGRLQHLQFVAADGNSKFLNGNVDIGGNNSGVLSFKTATPGSVPVTRNDYGRLYSRYTYLEGQASELVYVDNSGNVFPLTSSAGSSSNEVFYDSSGNLFVGSGCPSDRTALVSASGNTGYGNGALHEVTISGGTQGLFNTAMGFQAGSGLYASSGNIVIGSESMNSSTSGVTNNIIIGNNIDYNVSDRLLIGRSSNILLSGVMTDKTLAMPSGGSLSFYDAGSIESMTLSDHSILVNGSGARYGDNPFVIRFSGTLGNDLLTLDHSSHYTMSNTETYESVNPRRPFMHLDGDMRLRGALRFSDGTSMDSASSITNAQGLLDEFRLEMETQTIEGTMSEDVSPAISPTIPTSGIMTKLDGSTVWVSNRDKYLTLEKGDYVVASRITYLTGDEYRPVWVSNEYNTCGCARPSTLDGGEI